MKEHNRWLPSGNPARFALSLVAISIIMGGCGTTQPFAPAVPMPGSKGEFRFSIGYSTGRFQPFSIQWGAWGFVGSKDAIGMTWAGMLLPSAVSYVHYTSDRMNVQIHCSDLLGITFNPTWECDLGFSSGTWDDFQAGKIGVGFFDTPLLQRMAGKYLKKHAFVPILGGQLRTNEFALEASLIYGFSSYYVRYYKEQYLTRDIDTAEYSIHPFQPQTIPHASIKSIQEISSGYSTPQWRIVLDSNDVVVISPHDPYADCYACGAQTIGSSAYLASPEHHVFWVWRSRPGYESVPTVMEPNMKSIVERYQAGGDLVLKEDDDVLERKLARVHSGWDDIFFSIARVTQITQK